MRGTRIYNSDVCRMANSSVNDAAVLQPPKLYLPYSKQIKDHNRFQATERISLQFPHGSTQRAAFFASWHEQYFRDFLSLSLICFYTGTKEPKEPDFGLKQQHFLLPPNGLQRNFTCCSALQ